MNCILFGPIVKHSLVFIRIRFILRSHMAILSNRRTNNIIGSICFHVSAAHLALADLPGNITRILL